MRDIQLYPGDLFLSRDSARVETILGSCVAFTMRHGGSQLAAMCHCLLARKPFGKSEGEGSRYAYLDKAFEEMLGFFQRGGVRPADLEVKLFGGADVLRVLSGPRSVGRENIQAAQNLASQNGLHLLATDVGGRAGREVVFHTTTGIVKVKKMRPEADQEYALSSSPMTWPVR